MPGFNVCVSTLNVVRTTTNAPNAAFLRTYTVPVAKRLFRTSPTEHYLRYDGIVMAIQLACNTSLRVVSNGTSRTRDDTIRICVRRTDTIR